jgi:hypothetical protein
VARRTNRRARECSRGRRRRGAGAPGRGPGSAKPPPSPARPPSPRSSPFCGGAHSPTVRDAAAWWLGSTRLGQRGQRKRNNETKGEVDWILREFSFVGPGHHRPSSDRPYNVGLGRLAPRREKQAESTTTHGCCPFLLPPPPPALAAALLATAAALLATAAAAALRAQTGATAVVSIPYTGFRSRWRASRAIL